MYSRLVSSETHPIPLKDSLLLLFLFFFGWGIHTPALVIINIFTPLCVMLLHTTNMLFFYVHDIGGKVIKKRAL